MQLSSGAAQMSLPSAITASTLRKTSTSVSGSPWTAIRSADLPAATDPNSASRPSDFAALRVAELMACIGVCPLRTM
ncbi:hypothetical protein D3C80_2155600 [compost metagenome]